MTLFSSSLMAGTILQSQADVAQDTTSAQALAANLERKYLLIQNKGAAAVYVKFNSIHIGTEGISIPAGGNWEPSLVPLNSIWMKAASGTQTVSVIEGN